MLLGPVGHGGGHGRNCVVGEDCGGLLHFIGVGGRQLLGPVEHGGGDDRNCEGWGHIDSVGLGGCDDRVVVQAAVSCSIFSFISMYVRSQMHGKCTHNMHRFLSQSWKRSSTIT